MQRVRQRGEPAARPYAPGASCRDAVAQNAGAGGEAARQDAMSRQIVRCEWQQRAAENIMRAAGGRQMCAMRAIDARQGTAMPPPAFCDVVSAAAF